MNKKHTTPTVPPLTLEQAHELIFKLMERISELEDRLNQNSGNSSKPPSSNGPGGTPPARPRKRSGKQRGAQPGHKGHRRERHPQDERVTLAPHYPSDTCTCCGGDMLAHAKPHRVHQVFDLPEVSYFMTEHQLFRATCTRCIHTDEARLPETVSHTQMGANLLSYIALQSGQYHQSISQIQSQLKQHFPCTVPTAVEAVPTKLAGSTETRHGVVLLALSGAMTTCCGRSWRTTRWP